MRAQTALVGLHDLGWPRRLAWAVQNRSSARGASAPTLSGSATTRVRGSNEDASTQALLCLPHRGHRLRTRAGINQSDDRAIRKACLLGQSDLAGAA
jgi:hypothetical protein